jgi:hypothetical protein
MVGGTKWVYLTGLGFTRESEPEVRHRTSGPSSRRSTQCLHSFFFWLGCVHKWAAASTGDSSNMRSSACMFTCRP